jgi:hypothetical protein
MQTIINSQGFRGLGAVNVTRQPLTMCPDNADCSGPIVRARVPLTPVSGSTNGTIPGETQPAPTGMQSPLVGQTVIPQIVSTPAPTTTLDCPGDPLYPQGCPSGYGLTPLTNGVQGPEGGWTVCPTYECRDGNGQSVAKAASTTTIALFGDTSTFTIGSVQIGTTTALVAAAALAALFLFGGKK